MHKLGQSLALIGLITLCTAAMWLAERQWPASVNVAVVALVYLALINFILQIRGIWAGAFATALAIGALNFFFVDPRFTFSISNEADVLLLVGFSLVVVTNSVIVKRLQRRRLEAEFQEHDATNFYRLILELLGAHTPAELAQTLARRLQLDLPATYVEVAFDGWPSVNPTPQSAAPDHIEPIESSRGRLGEARIWGSASLQQMRRGKQLQTYASETALLLDRMQLSEAATRAQVLEQSDQLKGALLSSVSHELRTPLATITAGAESLLNGVIPTHSPEAREVLQDVRASSAHLSQLVNNLLDMSRIESGSLRPLQEWVDLEELAHGAVGHLRAELQQHQVSLDFPTDLPLVAVDTIQIDQVFSNLLINAAKYAPVRTPVRIKAVVANDDWLQVSVSNDSLPLSREDLARIFDKFQRVLFPERVLGTGLGLSICKGIVEAHGGRIWAENRSAGIGMDFHFTLPRRWHNAYPDVPPKE